MHDIERTYKNYLSIDYELLWDLIKDQNPNHVENRVICFIDEYHKQILYRRHVEAISPEHFVGIFLSYGAGKENYIAFCQKHNLTFINPSIILRS